MAGEETPREEKERARKAALEAQRARAADAEAILDNAMVKEAFAKIEDFTDRAWKDSKFDETDQRERAYFLYRALTDFRQHFKTALQSGELATHELKEMQKAEQGDSDTKGRP